MPEYLYPGVYVEEVDAGTQSIPGVSTSIDSARLQSLVAELKETLVAQVPEWTDSNEADPGVTLLQLFALLTENLLYRANDIPERGRTAALRAAAALFALGDSRTSACATLKRPRFFAGQLLDAATLQAEQDYHRDKLRRHNRILHGFGIVSGLGVYVEPRPIREAAASSSIPAARSIVTARRSQCARAPHWRPRASLTKHS